MTAPLLTCIVDDADDYRFVLQKLYTRFLPTYPVRFFASGQALLDTLPSLNPLPGLILLDRHMPQPDGHQTLVYLKEHDYYRTIPVVMMSADASPEEIEGCYQAGVNSFLAKQADFDSLVATLSTVCQYWLNLNRGA